MKRVSFSLEPSEVNIQKLKYIRWCAL